MLRGFLQTACFLVLGAIPALAQSHDRSHVRPYRHGPGHVAPDSASHAAIHAKLLGSWIGTLRLQHGVTSDLHMSIAHDSLHKMSAMMRMDGSSQPIAISDLVVNGDTLRWTQPASGHQCKATSILARPTPGAAESIQGRLLCEGGDIAFSLHRQPSAATSRR
jgi:hypothetical protein